MIDHGFRFRINAAGGFIEQQGDVGCAYSKRVKVWKIFKKDKTDYIYIAANFTTTIFKV